MEKQIQKYLYENIPLTKAMGIEVKEASKNAVLLFAPFTNNINHKKTVFGGSLHAVSTLACWSLLYLNLKEAGEEHVQIVIVHSDVAYMAPVNEDFVAECAMPQSGEWQRFIKGVQVKGRGRIELKAQIVQKGKLCVDYRGTFAAITSRKRNTEFGSH